MHYRQLADSDLQALQDITDLLDGRLDRLGREIDGHPDPDSFGLFDRWEFIVGVGLVACQVYLGVILGERDREARSRALKLGPAHRTGFSIAEIVHAGANYVKHASEPLASKTSIAVLEHFGVWKRDSTEVGGKLDYPMGNLFVETLEPGRGRFRTLMPLLEQWRDAVIEAEARSTPRSRSTSGSRGSATL